MKDFMYVGIRRDLCAAQQVVQSIHAAIEASWYYHKFGESNHPSVIVLGFKSEDSLNKFKEFASNKTFDLKEFREPDRNNELTSVAVYPVNEEQKHLFKKYKLLK